jgi:ribose-phosphate pyrophosphokinase
MKIFTGRSNPALAKAITEKLNMPLGDMLIDRFPDGEVRIQIRENIRGQDVFFVQSTCSPPNDNLMELLIAIDAMRRASAERITAVIPYFGYARQDRKDQPRVPISAKLVANLLRSAGADRVLTIDLHAQQIQGFFDIPVDHLYASFVMVRYLRQMGLENLVVVAPDPGGMKAAYSYSRMLKSGLAIVAKERTDPHTVNSYSVVGDVAGRTAILIDDLVATGGTLAAAAELLKKKGAKDIYAAITHAVFVPEAFERLKNSVIKEFIVTDTVPLPETRQGLPVKVLSVAELLAEAISRIHSNQSVSSLFKI